MMYKGRFVRWLATGFQPVSFDGRKDVTTWKYADFLAAVEWEIKAERQVSMVGLNYARNKGAMGDGRIGLLVFALVQDAWDADAMTTLVPKEGGERYDMPQNVPKWLGQPAPPNCHCKPCHENYKRALQQWRKYIRENPGDSRKINPWWVKRRKHFRGKLYSTRNVPRAKVMCNAFEAVGKIVSLQGIIVRPMCPRTYKCWAGALAKRFDVPYLGSLKPSWELEEENAALKLKSGGIVSVSEDEEWDLPF